MNTQEEVADFLAQKTLAIAGISRSPGTFSANAYQDLKGKGYRLFPVNPNAAEINGDTCYPNLSSLPEKVGGVVLFTPKSETEKVVREAASLGIKRVWIQQGAESEAALKFCADAGLSAISGQCVLMFAEPVATFHSVHKWFKRLFGGLPKPAAR